MSTEPSPPPAAAAAPAPEPEARLFVRAQELLGPGPFARLRAAHVVVVGLGGVGSHAAVGLARSGVGRLRLVDFDEVSWSSLNRSAWASAADVGRPKCEALAAFLRGVVGTAVALEPLRAFFADDSAAELLAGPPTLVLDCIDSVGPKVALLRGCVERRLFVASAMGAAGRTDPAAIRVADLARTQRCPLAREMRSRLRRHGIRGGIPVVYSEEPPVSPLPPDLDEPRLERGRVRLRLPSLAMIPAMFGHALAAIAVSRIAQGS